jgi:hypothetical protein
MQIVIKCQFAAACQMRSRPRRISFGKRQKNEFAHQHLLHQGRSLKLHEFGLGIPLC